MADYSTRFSTEDAVVSYENEEYGQDSYSSAIWELQQPVLREILEEYHRRAGIEKLLDFACGTGRVLSFFEKFSGASVGLDISEAMASRARKRCQQAEIFVGNICEEDDLVRGPYDVITSFRFLLNAGPELGLVAFKQLRKRLHEDRGLLIVNMHGNSGSVRHFFILARRFRRWLRPAAHSHVMVAEMSLEETRTLLDRAGFEVMEERGFGIVPSFFYRTPFRAFFRKIDEKLSKNGWFSGLSIDMIFICKPKMSGDL